MYWAMRGQPLPITGTGKLTRDFTYVSDIVDALLRAGYFEAAIGQEMNIASGRETEIVEMAEAVNAITGNSAGLVFTDRRKWDTKSRLLASIDRAREVLGYDPAVTFEAGLKLTLDWFKAHWDNINHDAEFPPGMSSAVKNYVLSQGQR
jgi:nucleoside-diphosphate-sugar epimerase